MIWKEKLTFSHDIREKVMAEVLLRHNENIVHLTFLIYVCKDVRYDKICMYHTVILPD